MPDDRLTWLIATYAGELTDVSYRTLAGRQDPPYASIGFGAAGAAMALSRAAPLLRDATLHQSAARLLRGAARDPRADATRLQKVRYSPAASSVAFARPGIHLAAALVAAAAGDDPQRLRATRRFLDGASSASAAEHYEGLAGALAGALMLEHAAGDARVRRAADTFAMRLLPARWRRMKSFGFAHGRAGVLHGLLRWATLRGAALPVWRDAELARLERDARDAGAFGGPRATFLNRGLCNGAAGVAILFARAFEHTADPSHARVAERAGRAASARASSASGDYCCGLTGRAYAMLALDRALPGRGWGDRAEPLALRAIDAMVTEWPNGLLKGYPGLVYLACDLRQRAWQRPDWGGPPLL